LLFRNRFNNRGLFADHYLKDEHGNLLKALPEWQQASGLDAAFAAIQKLFREKATRFAANTNEAQTERDFVRPILNILWAEGEPGDCYQVQVAIPNLDARRQPDYAFFRRAADREAAEPHKGTIEYWRDAPCLGDAKKWAASLDKQRAANENPSGQIANYLYRSRVRWGILTNGRAWRLYEREKSSAGGVFYEVDLEDLLAGGDREAFKYFYLFFRREAFVPDASGQAFIEKVFQGSVDFATAVGDRLKESVYDALCHLMNGFLSHPSNCLDARDPATIKSVHENSLIVLYRMLFILYAEDRGLLPCDDEHYRTYCLRDLHRQTNERLREHHPFLPHTTGHWNHLLNLFSLIDNGFPEGAIPAYNGSLFNPGRHPHIAHEPQPGVPRWEIGDRYLAEPIDLLAYDRARLNEPGTQDIDYNTLDVRHLGSIYEGLLELQPQVAAEKLVETSGAGKCVFKPERDVPTPRSIRGQAPRTVNAGEVYLVTNRGERKATGSYYTPQYIVSYIVEHTVGPLADEAARKVAELRPGVDKEIAKLRKMRAESEKGSKEKAAALSVSIEDAKSKLFDPYLSMKILDPAMGSGHFLVGAADFLSLAMTTDPNLLIPDDLADEEPQAYFKQLVVEHCLYGVDLNPLAVELAKLSLWLHTASRNKALSFLDHHLRCGNSLIGARMEDDLTKEPPRFNARGKRVNADSSQLVFGFTGALTSRHLSYLLDTFRKIVETPTGDAETERWKDGLYRDMDNVRGRFRAVANCWLAPYFGAPVTAEQYENAVQALRDPPALAKLQDEPWFTAAQAAAQDKRFFHWELEFPEVFFEPHGLKPKDQRGFDAVIGNPPYGRIVAKSERRFAESVFDTPGSTFEASAMFIERGTGLLKRCEVLGMIVPSGWLTAREHGPLREFVLSHLFPRAIVHLPYDVFPDAYVDCIVWAAQRQPPSPAGVCLVKRFGIREPVHRMPHAQDEYVPIEIRPWLNDPQKLIVTERGMGHWLRTWADLDKFISMRNLVTVSRGITPYLEPSEHDRRQRAPGFFGSVGRYELKVERIATVVYDPSLTEYKPPIFFSGPRLIIRRIISRQRRIHATLVADDFVINKSYLPALPATDAYSLFYVLAVLNSRLLSRAFVSQSEIAKRDDFPQLDISTVQEFPVRNVDFTTPAKRRAELVENGKQLCGQALTTGKRSEVLKFVDQQLSAKPERADVVHDLLGYLAEQMVEINRQKQVEVRSFLAWLERRIGAKTDDLSNKTKIRDYHQHDLDTLFSVLRANRRKVGEGANLTARGFQEAVEKEFNVSFAKLTPLKTRLVASDELIDEIVYRLYGLTEEEVAIVKGEGIVA